MQKIILHFDMNSYFASVEQQANPFLRGKPVGVVSTMSQRGCIIASSIEAKKYGIKTGCRVNEALQIYPDVKLIEVDPPKYRSTTKAIFDICAEYTEDIEAYSIDEAFLNLTGTATSYEDARRIGRELQRRIKEEVGEWLRCSIGIAWTRWLAKFAGDTAPKGEIVVLTKDTLLQYLTGRDLEDAWGIAGATAQSLNRLGINTLDQLARFPIQNLMSSLKSRGYYLWANVNGVELGGLEVKRPPKTIGHSHVLRYRSSDTRLHQAVLMRLAERAGRRLRKKQLEARGIYYYVQFDHRPSFGESNRLHFPIQSTKQLYRFVWGKLAPYVNKNIPAMFALGLFRLRPHVNQLSLFNYKKISPMLSTAIDEINNRYGEETIVQGTLLKLGKMHAPDRIGFRKTMDSEFRGENENYYEKI